MKNPQTAPLGTAVAVLVLMTSGLGWAEAGGKPQAKQADPATQQAPGADRTSAKPGNALRWTTGSEEELFGFDVYRADDKAGPFRLVTAKPIAATGSSDVPSRYSFTDESITPGQAYWYYVERISMSGRRTRFTPLIFAPAKPLVEPPPAPPSEPRTRTP